MHELPDVLTHSLRSYRGSIYGSSRKNDQHDLEDGADLEKGLGGDGDKAEAVDGSPKLHRARSDGALSQTRKEHAGRNGGTDRQDHASRVENHRRSTQRPQVDTRVHPAGSQATVQTPGKLSILHAPAVKDLDPAADRLAEDLEPLTSQAFYDLMGLRVPSSPADEMKKLALKNGLFHQMSNITSYTNRKYHLFAVAVYVLLVLQLGISAVFIILGSLRHVDTHITISVLGAVSTVIAGGLALMQGQGLPNRLRMSRDSLRSVVFEAEELFWDVRAGKTVLYKNVKKLREDFLRVLEEQKKNHPDAWNSVSREVAQGSGRGEGEKLGREKF